MNVRARDLATPVWWIDGSGSASVAARQLVASRAGVLPVCGPDRLFLGLLSVRDIVERCTAEGLDPLRVSAGALLDPAEEQHVLQHDQPADDRLLLAMFQVGLDRIPVVNGARFIGMVYLVDIAAYGRHRRGE